VEKEKGKVGGIGGNKTTKGHTPVTLTWVEGSGLMFRRGTEEIPCVKRKRTGSTGESREGEP